MNEKVNLDLFLFFMYKIFLEMNSSYIVSRLEVNEIFI